MLPSCYILNLLRILNEKIHFRSFEIVSFKTPQKSILSFSRKPTLFNLKSQKEEISIKKFW
jgi:hypothetical protein